MTRKPPVTRMHFVDLDRDQLLILDDQVGARVQVLYGGIWLTEERSAADRFAAAGQSLRLRAGGRAIVEALAASRLHVAAPLRKAGADWLAMLRRAATPIERVLGRGLAVMLAVAMSVGIAELTASGLVPQLAAATQLTG